MEEVRVWLSSNRLGEYWQNFEEHGWDELSLLTEMSDDDLEMCITKRGHRAKFRNALRSLNKAPANSGDTSTPFPVKDRADNADEVGRVSTGDVNQSTPLAAPTATTANLSATDAKYVAHGSEMMGSIGVTLEDDKMNSADTRQEYTTESVDAVRTVDKSDPVNTVLELDRSTVGIDRRKLAEVVRTDLVEIVSGAAEAPRTEDENETETESNASCSVVSNDNGEVTRLDENRIQEPLSNTDLSLSSDLGAVGSSFTVIDNRVVDEACAPLMNRGPPNITIIERSENTTVNQGPMQLHVGPPADETNSLVSLFKGQMEMLADSYRTKDHLFVETKAFNELKSVVEDMHWATLLGKPGDGKSATAAHLLLQYTKIGFEPVFLSSPRDWRMLISGGPSAKQAVVIDDIFGQSYLDDNKNVGEWTSLVDSMSRIVKQRQGNLVVICTSRRYIFKDIETALGKFDCFLKHSIVDMTEQQYKLSGDEKVAIFQRFTDAHNLETSTFARLKIRYVDPPHGFPHCVELYCSNAFLRKEGIAFFSHPVQFVHREISNFKDNDRVKFLVLLLVFHKGDKLGLTDLDSLLENTTDDAKKIFQTAGVSLEKAIPDIRRALTGLTNTYLKQNSDGSYSFSHHSLRETLAFIYISENPIHAIRAIDFQHIVAFTRRQKETANKTIPNLSFPFESLSKRMIMEIKDGHASTVCDCEVWSDTTFITKFVKFIENETSAFLETLLCLGPETYSTGSLMKCLIRKERYSAIMVLLESKTIGKTLQNSDCWLKCLQEGLRTACWFDKPSLALIRALGSYCREKGFKLDGTVLLHNMLCNSKADVAICLIEHTNINPDVAICLIEHTNINPEYGQYFKALAGSDICLPEFEVLCKMLTQAGFDINQTNGSVLAVFRCLTRIEEKGWDRLLCMIRYGANIHKQCKDGNVVLFVITNNRFNFGLNEKSTKCIDLLTKLSDLDIDFHCTDSAGCNALHIACQRWPDDGSSSLVEYLINKGVSAEAVDERGAVPLMLALKNNVSIEIFEILARYSPPKHVDKSGLGYFHYLLSSRDITNAEEFVRKCEIVLKLESSIYEKDNSGKPPIVQLMERKASNKTGCNLLKGFRYLHENGMDLHVKDGRGRNLALCVLDWGITEEVLPLLQYFHSVGLNLKLPDNDGRNALHHLFANVFYEEKLVYKYHKFYVTEREFPEIKGKLLKKLYEFLTDDIGLLTTVGDKDGIDAVMLALENCAGFVWIKNLLMQDIHLNEDRNGRNYLHFLAKSRAPDASFEILKNALFDKGLTVDMQILKERPGNITKYECD